MRAAIALAFALLVTKPLIAWAEDQTTTVGPWTIATSSKADKIVEVGAPSPMGAL
jgi:hypothetical protein